MGRGLVRPFISILLSCLALPAAVFAQEATISGTVKDSTSGVLPGVAVRAVHEATGTQFDGFTDERGNFRIPVRIGVYRITAELAGFATLQQMGLEVLVGQQLSLNLVMMPSTISESVTVTGEAPLVNVSSSHLGGNIDSRQLSELPVNGRNFLDLTMLVPGARVNHTDPGGLPAAYGSVQLNIDGMQVTNNCCSGSNRQPSFGRDAIAEFQLTGRFDATQGRSSGAQVNVITKSGTNTLTGTLSGYFRSDTMNAEDFVQHRVLPYSNQQVSTTLGGPIRRDKVHYFFNYEFEREPITVTHNSPYPSYNVDLTAVRRQHKPMGRVDAQISNKTRLAISSYMWRDFQPNDGTQTTVGGATNHPANAVRFDKYAEAVQGTMTRVISNRTINELKLGWAANHWDQGPTANWNATTGLAAARNPVANERKLPPVITLRGLNIGGGTNFPQYIGQKVYTLRDDFSFSGNMRGRHDLRLGGEYLNYLTWHDWCNFLRGNLIADNGPVPANIEQLFPLDPNGWNMAPLSPISREFRTEFGSCIIHSPRNIFGGWFQDDWQVASSLTLNLGLRYDLETDVFANELAVPPFLPGNRPLDKNNVGPRFGFAYSLNSRTVIRGGAGKYFSELVNQVAHPIRFANSQRVLSALYDGRPDFAVNPWNGPLPRVEDLEQAFCNVRSVPGCIRRALGQTIAPPNAQYPYSYQASIGMQRQIGADMGLTADYSFNGLRKDRVTGYNINLSFNPATGLGSGADGHLRGTQQLQRPGALVHQAHEPPLAGVRQLHPVHATRRTARPLERRDESCGVRSAGAVGRRVRARGDRPAPPRCVQWHLAAGIRPAAERVVLLRLRPTVCHDLRRRCARHGDHGRQRTPAAGECRRRFHAAQRPCRRSDSSCRPAPAETPGAEGQCRYRRHRRNIQRVQSRQLRFIHDRGKQ